MQTDKDELQEQQGSEKNNDKPIGVKSDGEPVVPPGISREGDGSGASEASKEKSDSNDTVGIP